jgi:hypothetical protein
MSQSDTRTFHFLVWVRPAGIRVIVGQKQVSAQDSFARIVPDAPLSLGGSLIYLDHNSWDDDQRNSHFRSTTAAANPQIGLSEGR